MLLLVLGFSTFACPDLSGNYECQYEDGTTDMTSVSNSGNVYTLTDSEGTKSIVADGQTRRNADEMNERAVCEGNSLIIVASAEMDGVSLKATTKTQKIDGNLITDVEVNFNGEIENSTQVCTAN
tara:strand:+ start:15753 stop:16127 length:375 start_codon:yes stop_codon:yes gene_type:complete